MDALGVEDLFTEGNRLKHGSEVEYRLGFVRQFRDRGKPVLLIEYGTNPQAVERSVEGAGQEGMVLLVTDRQLKSLGKTISALRSSTSKQHSMPSPQPPSAQGPKYKTQKIPLDTRGI